MRVPLKTNMGQVSDIDLYEEGGTESGVSADVGEIKWMYKDMVVEVSARERYRDEKCVNVKLYSVMGGL